MRFINGRGPSAHPCVRALARRPNTLRPVDKSNAVPVMGPLRTVLTRSRNTRRHDANTSTRLRCGRQPEQSHCDDEHVWGHPERPCAGLAGGLEVGASGNIRPARSIFEPIHGSAPKHTGQGAQARSAHRRSRCFSTTSASTTRQAIDTAIRTRSDRPHQASRPARTGRGSGDHRRSRGPRNR